METEVGKIMSITVIQKRPNTCVAISTVDETQYVGFSKVCWPDTWDSRTGLHVALGKAAAAMFGIKVPKSGRMDVHLLSDPRPGVETKGERALKEMREHLFDEQDQVEPDTTENVFCLDHPVRLHIPDHRTMEEKQDDERRRNEAAESLPREAFDLGSAVTGINHAMRFNTSAELKQAVTRLNGAAEDFVETLKRTRYATH